MAVSFVGKTNKVEGYNNTCKQQKHAKGKAITVKEKFIYPYLANKMWNHTECGFLFDNTPENKERLTMFKDEVTCKNCLKKNTIMPTTKQLSEQYNKALDEHLKK